MVQAQHTPGPWTANKARTLIHISGKSPVCEISVSANHIHEDFPGCKQQYIQRQKANARLIAVAPDMMRDGDDLHEALFHLIKAYSDVQKHYGFTPEQSPHIRRANDALKKWCTTIKKMKSD